MELVTGAMGSLLPKLGQLLNEEYGLQAGLRKKIESLSRELESVHAVLRIVGEVPPEKLDQLVKLWARDLREASYDMEDIIDSFMVHVDGREEPADPHMLRRLRKKIVILFKKTKARREIAGAIQDINEKLEEVAARCGRYTVNNIVAKPAVPADVDPRLLNLYKRATELVGIEGQMDNLIKMMSLGNDIDLFDKTVRVVSVVGIGGLGKTTLVKAVYDKLKPGFDCGAFVPVGQNPDMKKVLRDIIIDLDKKTYTNFNITLFDERQLINKLQEILQEKRCFVVIDDMWDKKSWGLIRCALQDSNHRSRVVVTTRVFEVATYVGDVYKMQPLSRNDSENSLVEACDKFLKKCGGVPLAIITIASLLANKPQEDWSEVYSTIVLGHGGNDDVENTRRILSLSYYDLPLHLKPCLLYLSIFPEDYYIEKNLLIWKWIAEGFVHEEQAPGVGLFELGEGYFNELINRSMIQTVEAEYKGYADGCHVHDMVLDLIRLLSFEENFVTVLDGSEHQESPRSKIRRLALQHRNFEENGHQLGNVGVDQLRSFVLSECDGITVAPPSFHVLRYLGNLHHLRYLGLQNVRTSELPDEVGDLKFLQVLDLLGTGIQELPESVGLLTKLLCLRANEGTRVSSGLIVKLTSLQEMWICPADISQFVKVLGKLRELRVLRTSLFTHGLDERTDRDLLESLQNLHKIHTIDIGGSSRMKSVMWEAGFTSPRRLRHLRLRSLVFYRMPVGINPLLLPNLCYLDLQVQIVKEQDMVTLGRLPELRHLKLCSCKTHVVSVENAAGDGYFRKLRYFSTPCSFLRFDLHGVICSTKTIMPRLESLEFFVRVLFLRDANLLGFDKLLGFRNHGRTSLRRVEATMACSGAHATEVEKAEAALAQVAAVHPNRPTLKTTRLGDSKIHSPYRELEVVHHDVNVRKIKDKGRNIKFSWLWRNQYVEKFRVSINCENASLREVKEAEETAREVTWIHPNNPRVEIVRYGEDKMVSEHHQMASWKSSTGLPEKSCSSTASLSTLQRSCWKKATGTRKSSYDHVSVTQ
uniref:RGH1A n=1 Tax=Oryza barthii TaxID=65489 RepID=A0A0D3GWS2_9ORYZ